MGRLIRQGDVLLKQVDKVDGKKFAENSVTIALGEVTGHSHVLVGNVTGFKNKEGVMTLQVQEDAVLKHEEHNHLSIPAGNYQVINQREFDLLEGVRRVSD